MITSFYYTADGALRKGLDEGALRAAVHSGAGLLWVDFSRPTDEETFLLDSVFGFHPLAIEDCRHISRYPKLDEFPGHLFLVLLAPNLDARARAKTAPDAEERDGEPAHELDVFLGRNYVVTYHAAGLDFMDAIVERTRRDGARSLGRGASFLLHDIVDAAVDQFFTMVERFQDEADEVEQRVQRPDRGRTLTRVLALRRRVLRLRRQISDHREVVQRLVRGSLPLLAPEATPYFRDVLDHLGKIESDLDACRDTLDSARDVYLALADVRINDVMRVLTVLFTLTVPAAVMTSWYGMNLKYLPFADETWMPWAWTGLMVAAGAALYLWFRARKWF